MSPLKKNDDVTKAIRSLLKIYHEAAAPETKQWLRSSLTWPIRYLERFVTHARVSVKAQEAAGAMDLSQCKWNQQPSLLDDPERELFHYEHMYPVSQMREKLIELSDPGREVSEDQIIKEIESELDKFDIAWVLKEEDNKLNEMGYQSKRPPNPLDAYREAGIVLLPQDNGGLDGK